jgi:hypothetical protein
MRLRSGDLDLSVRREALDWIWKVGFISFLKWDFVFNSIVFLKFLFSFNAY